MKTPILSLMVAFTLHGISSTSSAIVITDDFESYSLGRLTNGVAWSTPIPGHPALSWSTQAHKAFTVDTPEVSLVSGTSLGRDGTVVSAVSTNSRKAGITLDLPTGVSGVTGNPGAGNWSISIDFYIDSVANAASSTLWLLSTYEDTVDNAGMTFGVDYVYSSEGASTVRIRNTTTSTSTTLYASAATQEWYTLTITGNPENGATASFSLSHDGTEVASKADLPWVSSITTHAQFNRVVVGGGNDANISSSVYFDDFSLTAVPETSSLAYLAMGAIAFWVFQARRRQVR